MTRRFRSMLAAVSLLFPAVPMFAQSLERAPDHMYLLESSGGTVNCRIASQTETAAMAPSGAPLHVIYPEKGQTRLRSGLNITLRSTDQLEGFPAAKAAFQAAAAIWEARIGNTVNVTIDVDYGPTRFGTEYPSPDILGSTNDAGYYVNYSDVRETLLAHADNGAETTLYNSLPLTSVPTDLGPAVKLIGSYAQLQNLGFTLPPDDAPAIGFNSAFSFDLDPSNGITHGQFDFEAVAVHEMGHALGFGSAVGYKELDSTTTLAPYIWDLFRFRPGVTSGTFQSAQRPQSSGGSHVSFVQGASLNMSTGRPDGTGGDSEQSSHWKDNVDGNPYIGLMDPTIPPGFHGTLTQNDLNAFDTMGYLITNGVVVTPPAAPSGLTATATSSSTIRLNWTDNSNNEAEFRVEQKSGASFTDIGSATANSTQINVNGLSAGQTATFRIRARNTGGDSSYSNEATATTTGGGNPGGSCTPNATTVCLANNRFRVSINYVNPFSNPPNQPGTFLAARLDNTAGINPDTALFGFSSAQAVEVVVRIQDARPFAPRFDIYYGGMTDVGYTVTVTDTATGQTRQYNNQVGKVGGGVDRTSFPAAAVTPDRVITSGGHDAFYDDSLRAAGNAVAAKKVQHSQQLTVGDSAPVGTKTLPRASAGGGSACSEVEPNNTVALADTLTLGAPCTGNAAVSDSASYIVDFEDPDPDGKIHDVFKVTTTTAAPLSVTMTFTNSDADLDIYLFTVSGNTFTILDSSIGVTTTETFTTNTLPAGTYYVGVSAYEGSSNYTLTATQPVSTGPCVANSTTVCLLNSRFRATINYINPFSNPPNQPGTFLAARLLSTPNANPDTGIFGFASAQAVEVVVRVQDTRPFAQRFDVYYGGMTDVEYTITVTDTQTNTTRTYHNNAGVVGGGVDRTSFPAN